MTARTHCLMILLGVACSLVMVESRALAASSIAPICTPAPCNTWQQTDVSLQWNLVEIHSTTGCEQAPAPFKQEGRWTVTCSGLDSLDQPISRTAIILIDKTPPKVAQAIGSPMPNALGWHTSAVNLSFQGTDTGQVAPTSGIASCTQAIYSGPDTAIASMLGTCRDVAGNVSESFTHTFKYDATPPALAPLAAEVDDRVVKLRWTGAEAPIAIARTPGIGDEAASVVYRGSGEAFTDANVKNSVSYEYRATVTDAAGHVATQVVGARPFRGFFAPADGARVTGAPRLAWTEIRNAGYYNIQLFRGSKKILSVWPKTTAYALRSTWKFQGTRFKLAPGAYRVYIWPGFGAFAKQRYGRIVGSRTFVVRPR